MQKISPFLWFDTQAEAAAKLYTSIFKNSKITNTTQYPQSAEEVSGKSEGTVMTVAFELDGVSFTALNGGPNFTFNESVSFVVNCESQEEVDEYWNKLTADGGQESQCGWLKDKFGLSWQIVPTAMGEILSDPDPAKADRAMKAMLQMKKIVIADLEKARDQT
ncbi:MAG: 3-demethylubiquinone-9 3-methyltransferase [Candidatus Saccharibacteria bacterium]|nr:3-demethylubiquinone-9 3-methyltransferase [Candidatus Saccharibacteria bacterium]